MRVAIRGRVAARDTFYSSRGTPRTCSAAFDAVQAAGTRELDHVELDCEHGRVIRRTI
jgi:hypothetical protein